MICNHFSESPSYFHLMTIPYREFAAVSEVVKDEISRDKDESLLLQFTRNLLENCTKYKKRKTPKSKFPSLTLTCNASGFPPPRIFWERQVGLVFIDSLFFLILISNNWSNSQLPKAVI